MKSLDKMNGKQIMVPKFNLKMVERGKIDTPNTHT